MSASTAQTIRKSIFNATVMVAALGYFVDVYDLQLFAMVRVQSLRDLGLDGDALTQKGIFLLNMQMAGIMIGAVVFGVLGDRLGRRKAMFGSILLYSLATLANGYVTTVDQYAVLRLISGIGLAGEIGTGVTLVAENLPRRQRNYGIAFMAILGVLGTVLAGLMVELFHWRTCYIIGGVAGLLLLLMRVATHESQMFVKTQLQDVSRGNILMLFNNGRRLKTFLSCILIGTPIYFSISIFVVLAPEIARHMGVDGTVRVAVVFAIAAITMSLSEIFAAWIGMTLQSRRKVFLLYYVIQILVVAFYFSRENITLMQFYGLYVLIGFGFGYWVALITTAAEHFGTNLRSMAATTVPNFIRGTTILFTSLFTYFLPKGIIVAASMTGCVALALALIGLMGIQETFDRDLDYVEQRRG